jgi:hypothetical protein
MSEGFVIAFLEMIGAFVRFSIMFLINKLFNKKYKSLHYYLDPKNQNNFNIVNNDYANGIIGFIFFVGVLTFLYFVL